MKSSISSPEAIDIKQIIETGLGSIGKIKIMKALAEQNKLTTIYGLHKKTHLKREDIKSNISDLVSIGWVNESRYANVMYEVNRDNKYVDELIEFFRDVGYIGQP